MRSLFVYLFMLNGQRAVLNEMFAFVFALDNWLSIQSYWQWLLDRYENVLIWVLNGLMG